MRLSSDYRGTSLTRNSPPLGPYGRLVPRALWRSQCGRFFCARYPCLAHIRQSRPDSGLGFQVKSSRGRDTRQENVEGSPTESRISPSIHRIPRQIVSCLDVCRASPNFGGFQYNQGTDRDDLRCDSRPSPVSVPSPTALTTSAIQ